MYKNILIPVLLDDEHDATSSFAAARALADKDAKFTVIHIHEIIPAYVLAEIPDAILMNTHDQSEKKLRDVAKGLPGADLKLVSGHAGGAIVDYIKDHNIDCVIVESHRPGIQDFFLGSTASRVVRHANCSVHVIR